MRKLIIALIITTSSFAQSQFRINKKESFNFSIIADPYASIKENGLLIGAEIEYSGTIYTRVGISNFAVLTDGYTDFIGGIGINFTSGYQNNVRYYLGGRLGVIKRKGANATAGFEGGIDFNLSDDIFIGGRLTYDYRSDQEFYDYPNSMKHSGFLRLGFNF